jgi:two-component system sensor histidine kinase VicK
MASESFATDFFQALVEQTFQAFFVYDTVAERLVYKSPSFEEAFPLPAEAETAASLKALVHPEDRDYVVNRFGLLLERGRCEPMEFRVQLAEMEEQWVCLTVSRKVFSERIHVLGHLEDVTAQRKYNDHMKKFSNKKNSVLNILSHDLAGPLGMIHNLSNLLAEQLKEKGNEETLHLISLIERSSNHGSTVIQQFMSQEFLESVKTDLVTRRVNIVEKIKQALDEYQSGGTSQFISKQIDFVSSKKAIYGHIDDLKFLQALSNLLSNSLKFTPDGGLITVTVEDEETTVLVKVADTGIGIPEKYHDSLFDKFTPARRPGLKGEQTVGLGLSIVKTIIDWHKGQLWFESVENQGTTFYIRLPKN